MSKQRSRPGRGSGRGQGGGSGRQPGGADGNTQDALPSRPGGGGGGEPPFVVAPGAGTPTHDASGLPMAGGTELDAAVVRIMRARHVANPDDPPVERPLHGVRGPLSAPDQPSMPGRIAIVQGQIYIVGVIVIAQLFLVTTALFELLSGQLGRLWWIGGASLGGFLVALVVAIWPRRRVRGG